MVCLESEFIRCGDCEGDSCPVARFFFSLQPPNNENIIIARKRAQTELQGVADVYPLQPRDGEDAPSKTLRQFSIVCSGDPIPREKRPDEKIYPLRKRGKIMIRETEV